MSTPQHLRATCVPSYRGGSTSDPPIYAAVLSDLRDQGLFSEQDRPPVPLPEPPDVPLPEPQDVPLPVPPDVPLPPEYVSTREVLARVLDGLQAMPADVESGRHRKPIQDPGALGPSEALPKRNPGAQLPPGVLPRRSDARGVPPVPEVSQFDREPFTWLPPQAVVAGGR